MPGAGARADGVPMDTASASPGSSALVQRWPGGWKRLRAFGTADLSRTGELEMAGEGELRIPPGCRGWDVVAKSGHKMFSLGGKG